MKMERNYTKKEIRLVVVENERSMREMESQLNILGYLRIKNEM